MSNYTTQMDAARKGIVTPEIEKVAKKEKMDVDKLMELVASGKVAIPANKHHKSLDAEGVGSMLRTKINVNLGVSRDCKDYDVEMQKVMSAVKLGAEAIMDLSSHGNTQPFRQKLTSECPAMIGTVPVYDSVIHYQRDLATLTAQDFVDVVRLHAEDGVDFVTLHCGITRKTIDQIKKHKRKMNIVSRGGSLVFAWMCMTGEENPFYEHYDEILEICEEHDVTISLGDACRPGCLADATDVCQIEELVRLGELTKRAWDHNVQVMVEGPGHVPLDQVAANMKVQQSICMGAPFYVLGPLVTDIAPGYDHITAAIGGAVAAMNGAAFLCYVTPAEHLALPNVEDTKQGIIASKIAAHAADIAKGIPGARDIDDKMADATEEEMASYMEETGLIQELLSAHDFYMIDAKVEEVGRALGLAEVGLDRDVTELSGGQRTKVLLGKLLLEKPDILLLDEPTNYLDVEHIEWLKRYLNDYENAFILISHDIPFLNSVVNLIYHMDNQQLNRYVGDYDKFQEVYAVKKAQLEAAYNRQQKEIAQLKDFVARNKARVSTRNMAMSRQKKLDKMDVIELAAEKPKPEFNFRYGRTPGKMLFETHDLVIGYDEPLSKPLNFTMERGQKIALVGTNGIGKTTLLRSLLGLNKPISGSVEQGENLEIGYFEQEVKGENKTTCIEELWQEFPSFSQYEVRSALAKCGLTTKHIESQVRVLSGGEQAKVRLCKLVNRDTNILLLDEPTNHLDVDAKDELKKALREYRGSILLICHEPEFYQDVVNEVWDMSKWTTKIF